MSLQPLVAWWPERATGNRKTWPQRQRQFKRAFKRQLRSITNYLRSQYYLPNALADSYRAFKRNADIAWGSLMLMAGLGFAAISVIANATYYFVMAGSVLSTVSGANLAMMAGAAIVIIAVLALWLCAFVQNVFTLALYEGSTRKQNKSLGSTVRRGLRRAGQTASAWCLLLGSAMLPGGLLNSSLLLAVKFLHFKVTGLLPLVFGLESVMLAWAIWVVANYSLLPVVALIEHHKGWRITAARARQLVNRKGRLFTLSVYLLGLTGLAIAYLLSILVQAVTHTNSSLGFLLLALIPLATINAALVMLYRKRQLARA